MKRRIREAPLSVKVAWVTNVTLIAACLLLMIWGSQSYQRISALESKIDPSKYFTSGPGSKQLEDLRLQISECRREIGDLKEAHGKDVVSLSEKQKDLDEFWKVDSRNLWVKIESIRGEK